MSIVCVNDKDISIGINWDFGYLKIYFNLILVLGTRAPEGVKFLGGSA